MIIGIMGSIAGGKDTVAEYLKGKGYDTTSLSDIIRENMKEAGVEITTVNLTDFGNKLRAENGNDILARLALKKMGGDKFTLTSIRQTAEVEFLKKQPNFVLLAVDAPIELRYKRLKDRDRAGDCRNLAELQEIENRQANDTGSGMNLQKCFEMADYKIMNDGTLEDLRGQVDKILEEING